MLFTPIRSKTPALQRHGLHHSAKRECPRSTLRGDDSAGKRSNRKSTSSSERFRLQQPLLPLPQEGRRPPDHPWSQTPKLSPHEDVVQADHIEIDPLADSARGLVLFSGPEGCILSPITDDSWDSPSREWLISTQSFPLDCLWPPALLRIACMDAALSPLWQMGVRILNHLEDWLILA